MSGNDRQGESRGTRNVRLPEIGTTLSRARCPQPSQITRMRQSLSTHGQLTPVIAVERQGNLELVDGFKRRSAASQMGWQELVVTVRELDERAQWAVMLTLNRRPGTLSVLEEALILRELFGSGLTQVEIAQMVGRHKSWVSRRIGLVERLHSDLVEWVRTGMMSAGTARRLMVLPAGNQLEMAAVVSQAGLSTQETEVLVSLWRKTSDPEIKRFLLSNPRRTLEKAQTKKVEVSPDPRLSAKGKSLARGLSILRGVALRVTDSLHPAPEPSDLALLAPAMRKTVALLPGLQRALGIAAKCASSAGSSATSGTRTSADC